MKQLIKSTSAYKIVVGDRRMGRLSHAYMLHFDDAQNLREVLKMFAAEMYGGGEDATRMIMEESFADVRIYPAPDKKLSVDDASDIIDDSSIMPTQGDKKIYIISAFDQAAALFQNKLLKSLEEPPDGVSYLLGVTSLSSVLTTVKSRVRTLEIAPFTADEVYGVLEREGHSDINAEAARAAGGVLSVAQNMVKGGVYDEILTAARDVLNATRATVGEVAAKYKDFKHKNELLSQIQLLVRRRAEEKQKPQEVAPLINLCERIDRLVADVRFNVSFSQTLYSLMIGYISDKEKWKRIYAG